MFHGGPLGTAGRRRLARRVGIVASSAAAHLHRASGARSILAPRASRRLAFLLLVQSEGVSALRIRNRGKGTFQPWERAARGAARGEGAEKAEFAGLVLIFVLTFRRARRKCLIIRGVTLTGFEPVLLP